MSFDEQVELYAALRSRLGSDGISQAWSLRSDEFAQLNKIISDVARRRNHVDGELEKDSRNATIAQLRLLSWIETIGQRNPQASLSFDLEQGSSEEESRKQIRAVELVIRSLVGERHGNQQELVEHLRSIFGNRVVDKWQRDADRDDVLSGTAFSELASIFVNKQEFAHHENVYEETPFLTLLREKRKTIQSFLEDIRRIRNVLAHHKQISNVQLCFWTCITTS